MRCACGTGAPYPSQPLHLARRPIAPSCPSADTMRYAASGKVIPHRPTSTPYSRSSVRDGFAMSDEVVGFSYSPDGVRIRKVYGSENLRVRSELRALVKLQVRFIKTNNFVRPAYISLSVWQLWEECEAMEADYCKHSIRLDYRLLAKAAMCWGRCTCVCACAREGVYLCVCMCAVCWGGCRARYSEARAALKAAKVSVCIRACTCMY